MIAIEKLHLNKLKQEIVRSEIDSVKNTIQQLLAVKRAMETHHTDLIIKMMALTSEEVELKTQIHQSSKIN
jgi:hypothetical protein